MEISIVFSFSVGQNLPDKGSDIFQGWTGTLKTQTPLSNGTEKDLLLAFWLPINCKRGESCD